MESNRLRIVEYFDSLRNQLDLFTEIKISQNVEHERFWNKRRQKQIEVIERLEQAGLVNASKKRRTDECEEKKMSDVLTDFCFAFEFADMMFLATVDRYVEEKEIEAFKKALKGQFNAERYFTDEKKISGIEHFKFETNVARKFEEILTAETVVVDMSWWFTEESYDFDRVSCEMNVNLEEFTCPFKIRHLEIKIRVFNSDYSELNIERINQARELCERIQNIFKQAQSISIILDCQCSSHYLDQEKIDQLSLISSLKWDQHTSPQIRFSSYNSIMTYQKYCQERKRESLQKNIFFTDKVFHEYLKAASWSKITELEFLDCKEYSPSNYDLSGLRSLRSCTFRNSYFYYTQFLDPIRDQLESLCLQDNGLSCISWQIFRGMKKLKCLEFKEPAINELELDDQKQLFADLVELKSLKIVLNQMMINKKWYCELPALDYLEVQFNNHNYRDYKKEGKLRFKLPALSTFNCSYYDDSFYDTNLTLLLENDITKVFSGLSHVQKLIVPSVYLKTGSFKGFKCSKLVCKKRFESTIDKELFIGLDCIKEVELFDVKSIKQDAFQDLVNIQIIRLPGFGGRWLESAHSRFDGLRELKVIDVAFKDRPTVKDSFIFSKNLDKFVLVHM